MVVARGREQERLGHRAERLCGTREQHVAHDVGAGRAARLARHHDADGEPAQARREPLRLRRLAGALAAFECDEASAHALSFDVNRVANDEP